MVTVPLICPVWPTGSSTSLEMPHRITSYNVCYTKLLREELLLISQLSSQNIVVFLEVGNCLHYLASWLAEPGEIVFVKLEETGGRGHFERVFPATEVEGWKEEEACLHRELEAMSGEDSLAASIRKDEQVQHQRELEAMLLAEEMSSAFRRHCFV